MAKRRSYRSVAPVKAKRPRARRANLGASGRVTECGKRYARCVLDPLAGSPAKIPDGAAPSVLIEYDLAVVGTPDGSGNLSFGAIPGLPCSAWGLFGTFTGIDREGGATTVAVGAGATAALFPFKDFKSGVTKAIAGSTVYYNAPLEVQSARVVSLKLEVTPTGALLQQGGAAVTGRVPMEFIYHPKVGDVGVLVGNKTYAGASAHPFYGTYERPPTSFAQLSAFPDTKVCSGTESCVLMTIQPDDDYSSVIPTWSCYTVGGSPTLILNGDTAMYTFNNVIAYDAANNFAAGGTTASSIIGAMVPSDITDIAAFGNFWQPNNCEALVWAGQGLPTGQSYTFRVRACMELMVSHVTSTYRPFVTPAEQDDPIARKHVRNIVRSLPSSLPKEGTSPGWWSNLTQAASGLATAVSELGLPVISPVAGVAKRLMNVLGV